MQSIEIGLIPGYLWNLIEVYEQTNKLPSVETHKLVDTSTHLKTGGETACHFKQSSLDNIIH